MSQALVKTFTVLGASAAAALAVTSPVYAEERTPTKKPIYDTEERIYPTIPLEQHPTSLTIMLRNAREEAYRFFTLGKSHGQLLVDQWIEGERKFAALVKRTVPESERLAPGIIYVGIAALAGPIFTHKRNFAVRWASPLLFGAASAFYFLPGTSNVILRNVWARYGDPETIDRIRDQWRSVKQTEQNMRKRISDGVQELRLSLQEGNGFNVQKQVEQTSFKTKSQESLNVEQTADKTAPAVKEAAVSPVSDAPKETKPAATPASASPANVPLGFKKTD